MFDIVPEFTWVSAWVWQACVAATETVLGGGVQPAELETRSEHAAGSGVWLRMSLSQSAFHFRVQSSPSGLFSGGGEYFVPSQSWFPDPVPVPGRSPDGEQPWLARREQLNAVGLVGAGACVKSGLVLPEDDCNQLSPPCIFKLRQTHTPGLASPTSPHAGSN